MTPIEFTPSEGNGASPVTSNSKSCTAGSALLVIFYCDEWNTAPVPTCTVTGATPELIVSHAPDTSSPRTTAWIVPNIPGGTTSATISGFNGTRNWQIQVVELPGAATASPIDAYASHNSTASSQQFYGGPSGGITIAAGSIAFSILSVGNNPGTMTPDTGWAAITGLGTGTGNYLKTAYKDFPAGGSSERGLQTGTDDRIYTGLIVAIKAGVTDTTPPVITGPSGAAGASTSAKSVAENTTAVHTFTSDETVTWSITGGADAADFTINSSTGALAFATAPNYESPADADANNVYVVIVTATDAAANASSQTVTVTVTDANEAPTFTGTISIPSLTVGTAMSSYATAGFFGDPDAGDTAAYSAIGTWPAGVTVNSTTGAISGTPTTAGTYASLQVRRTDGGSLTIDSNTFTITVAAPVLSITTDALEDETNTVLASTLIAKLAAVKLSDMTVTCTWTNQTTDGSGVLTLSHASLTAVPHLLLTSSSDGADAGAKVYTPA